MFVDKEEPMCYSYLYTVRNTTKVGFLRFVK